MIGKYRKAKQVNPEQGRLLTQLVLNPGLPMVKILAAHRIVPEEKAPTDDAIHHMHDGDFIGSKNFNPSEPCHTNPSNP